MPVRKALRPLVIGSQAVPIPVIAPLFILVLGFGLAPKVADGWRSCASPGGRSTSYDGLRDSTRTRASCCARSDATRWQRLRLLEAPSALPTTFTGMKIAAAVAVIGAVFAEWAGSDRAIRNEPSSIKKKKKNQLLNSASLLSDFHPTLCCLAYTLLP